MKAMDGWVLRCRCHCKPLRPARPPRRQLHVTWLAEYPELTPKMRSVLERMARVRHQPMYLEPPQAARALYEGSAEVLEVPRRPLARVEDIEVPARDGTALPARIYQTAEPAAGVLLYLH